MVVLQLIPVIGVLLCLRGRVSLPPLSAGEELLTLLYLLPHAENDVKL